MQLFSASVIGIVHILRVEERGTPTEDAVSGTRAAPPTNHFIFRMCLFNLKSATRLKHLSGLWTLDLKQSIYRRLKKKAMSLLLALASLDGSLDPESHSLNGEVLADAVGRDHSILGHLSQDGHSSALACMRHRLLYNLALAVEAQ